MRMSRAGNPGIRPVRGDVALLRDLVHERTGLYFGDAKIDTFLDKLSPLVAGWGFDSLLDYYYLLKSGPVSVNEWRKVFDALTVQESFFWREIEQIRSLVEVIVPEYFRAHPNQTLSIWSAACAAGEEPLTIAMALHEAGWFNRARIHIHASDASPRAIEAAKSGLYRERAFRSLPPRMREKYFVDDGGLSQVTGELHSRVRWRTANLISKPTLPWPRWRLPSSSVETYSSISPRAPRERRSAFLAGVWQDRRIFSSGPPNR